MKRLKRLTKGQGLVEFALILPILLIILLGIVEAALLIQGHLTVQHIARETARWAVTYQPLQGACLDADNDGEIADGLGIDGPDADFFPDDDDPDDYAPFPACPVDNGTYGGLPDITETDEDYYRRRVQLIKQHAMDISASLRVRQTATGLTEGNFASNLDEPGFFGVRVWGYPAADTDCDDPVNAGTAWSPSNPNGCLDHPGLEGLPVMVHIQHNVEIVDPIYSIFGTYLTVQANSVMINEGIQVGTGDKPPTFGWSSTTSIGAVPPGAGGPAGCLHGLNTITILGPDTGYTGTTYTFNSVPGPLNATHPITYTWSPPPDSGQGTDTAQYHWDAVGDHTITLTANNCGGGDNDTHSITLEPPPSLASYDLTLKTYPENLEQVTNGWTDRCHDFMATVLLNGNPLENEWVSFRIEPPVTVGSFQYSGDDPSDVQVQTDSNGQAKVQLCGNDAGTAVIRAWLDIGSVIGTFEPSSEPSDTATKIWTFPVPPNPYIIVSRYEAVSGDRLEAYAMQHTASTQYGLFWCVITGTASVDTSQLLTLEGPPPTTNFITDISGNSTLLAFNIPVGSSGWYRLETRPVTSDCTDGAPFSASPEIKVLAARPDLTVIDVISTTPMCPGNVYPVQVIIQNTTHGSTDGSAEVDFNVNPDSSPPIGPVGDHKQWMPALGPYETYTMTTNVWFEDGGQQEFWVRVDTNDRIEESDEDNNAVMFTMEIGTAAYCEQDKTVVIAATDFQGIEGGSFCGAGKSWVPSDVGGVPTMGTVDTNAVCADSGTAANAPVLRYTVNFTTTGVYRAFFRGESADADDNSVWLSVDGPPNNNCYRLAASTSGALEWDSARQDAPFSGCIGGQSGPLAIQINTAGEHTIEVRMREDGYEWAKLMLIHEDRLALAPTGGSKPQAHIVPEVRPRPKAQTVAWLENFTGLPNGTQDDWWTTEWHTDLSGIPFHDYFEVMNGEFRAQDTDGEGVWTSEDIDISTLDLVQVSVDIREAGYLENDDCIRIYYRIDGGPETMFYGMCNDFGASYQTVSVSGLSGSTVQIVIRADNDDNDEAYYWDNVTVSGVPLGSLPWPEDFPQANGTTQDMGATAWVATRASGAFSVQNNQMCIWGAGSTSEAVWASHGINISGETSVDISLDLWSYGVMEAGNHAFAGNDWFYVYYTIDGGAEQLIQGIDGRTVGPDPLHISISGLSGNTLRLIVRTRTTGSDERYCFDNINITSTGPTAIPTIAPTAGPTPIPPTPLPTLTPPAGGDDPPATYCGCTPGSMKNPWAVGKPPGLIECHDPLLDTRSAGFEGNFNNVFPPWVAGPVVGSWLRQSVEHYPSDPSNSLRLATTLGVLPSCSPLPDPYVYQTITLPSTEVYTHTTLVVRGQILVRAPQSSAENQCCTLGAGADADDSLYVQMQDSGGTPLTGGDGLEIATGSTTPDLWQSFSVDVTSVVSPVARAGQDLRLNIHGIQGDSDGICTYFFLDVLECEMCTYWAPPPVDPTKASFGGLVTVVQQGRPQWPRGVDVYAYSPNGTFQHTQTIQDGSYHFYNLPTGEYTIYAIYQDDQVNAQTMTVTISEGDRSDLHFILFTSD